jgi:hypothetical protein
MKPENDNTEAESNVVAFTGSWKGKKPGKLPENIREGQEALAKLHNKFAFELTKVATTQMFNALEAAGVKVLLDERYVRDVKLVREAVKSLILKSYGIPGHKLQDIAIAFYPNEKVVFNEIPMPVGPGPMIA